MIIKEKLEEAKIIPFYKNEIDIYKEEIICIDDRESFSGYDIERFLFAYHPRRKENKKLNDYGYIISFNSGKSFYIYFRDDEIIIAI